MKAAVTEPETNPPDLSYEQASAQLTEVVAKLESGGALLAESVELWRKSERLAAICLYWLDGAKQELEAAPQADG